MTFDIVSWPMLIFALGAFGFAPGLVLRLIVLAFPRHDPRRKELLGELYAVPRFERPFWVAEQLEVALFEGVRGRFIARRARKRKLASAVDASNLQWIGSTFNAAIGGGIEMASWEGKILIRNAAKPDGSLRAISPSVWKAFVNAARSGEFDHLIVNSDH
jgi:Domain of unknown function (DUF397)